MNGFLQSELKGREIFKSFLDQVGATGLPTEQDYDTVDYFFLLKGKKFVAELKVRNEYYDEYLIEVPKLKALLQKKEDLGLDGAFYVCIYGNTMYVFSTNTITKYGTTTLKYCKRHTVLNDGYRLKDIVLVPTNRATKFELIDGKWLK